jgi:hypothetical protein
VWLPDERHLIKLHTEALGGAYHSELTKSKCTHLIASSAQSDKYQYAQRWGSVKNVSLAWFEQSVKVKGASSSKRCQRCRRVG